MARNNEERMGREKISRLLLQFSLPAIAAVLTQGVYNLVARLFVGREIGHLALAGVQVAFPLMLIQFGLFVLICGGATALVSIRLGEDRKEDANRIFANGLTMVILMGLVMPVTALPNINWIMDVFATSENIAPYAKEYLQVILAGSPLMAVNTYFSFLARGEGNPKRSMQISLISTLSNIVMTFLFIVVFDMGVKGAALATVLASVLGLLWGVQYFSGHERVLILHVKNLLPRLIIVRNIVTLGFSSCIGTFATGIQSGILIRQIQLHGGDIGAASVGIMFGVISIFIMPIFGLSDAVQPIVGYNYGAGKLHRVRQTLTTALTAGIVYALCATIIIEVFADFFVGLFAPGDLELQTSAAWGLRLASWAMCFAAVQIMVPRYLQAIGKALEATILGLTRQVLFFIPLVFILPAFLGLTGAWLTISIADFGAGIVCGIRVFGVIKKRSRADAANPRQISAQQETVLQLPEQNIDDPEETEI